MMTTKQQTKRFHCKKCGKKFQSGCYWREGSGYFRIFCPYCGLYVFWKPESRVTECKNYNSPLDSRVKMRLYMREYRKRQNAGKN